MQMFDLKRFRTERNLSQRDIAKALGVSSSFLSVIEHGKKPVPASVLDKLCELYDVENIDDYISETSPQVIPTIGNHNYNVINSPQGVIIPYELVGRLIKPGVNDTPAQQGEMSSLIQVLNATNQRLIDAENKIKKLEAELEKYRNK